MNDIQKTINQRKYIPNTRSEVFTEVWLKSPLCELTAASLANPFPKFRNNTVLSYSNVRRFEKSVRTGPEEETSLIVPLCGDTVAVTSEIRNYDYNSGITCMEKRFMTIRHTVPRLYFVIYSFLIRLLASSDRII
jgi:hypothetical protein